MVCRPSSDEQRAFSNNRNENEVAQSDKQGQKHQDDGNSHGFCLLQAHMRENSSNHCENQANRCDRCEPGQEARGFRYNESERPEDLQAADQAYDSRATCFAQFILSRIFSTGSATFPKSDSAKARASKICTIQSAIVIASPPISMRKLLGCTIHPAGEQRHHAPLSCGKGEARLTVLLSAKTWKCAAPMLPSPQRGSREYRLLLR